MTDGMRESDTAPRWTVKRAGGLTLAGALAFVVGLIVGNVAQDTGSAAVPAQVATACAVLLMLGGALVTLAGLAAVAWGLLRR